MSDDACSAQSSSPQFDQWLWWLVMTRTLQ
jgi:hypothetical protein